jgi:hypothetical protein
MPNPLVLDTVEIFKVVACQMSNMKGKALLILLVLDTVDTFDDNLGVVLQLAVDVCCT